MWRLAPVLVSLGLALARTSARAEELPRADHRYELEATLDPEQRAVHGRVRIHFTNTSQRPLEELVFHLYMNAFNDDESVFMRESGGSLRGQRFRGEGSITLSTLTIDGADVLATSERELVQDDRTQLRVPLSTPLPEGSQLTIESHFEVALPPVFARTGYAGDFFTVAQWFPKLAKLEPDGHFESFPYHALGEFYADFADYRLTVRTPAAIQVVASGSLVEEQRTDHHVVRRFEARLVHDLAFVAARGFRSEIEHVDGVTVRYLAPPGYERALAQHAFVVRRGLLAFGRAFGRYPYPSLSVVIPPRDAAGAAGMEYPTLFLSAAEWLTCSGLPSLSGAFVAAHELAHQWFYGILASNEQRHPVLDEGLAQWAALDLLRELYGAREGLFGVSFDRFEIERWLALHAAPSTAAGQTAHAYGRSEYAASVYGRAALALESIRRAYGRARFERALWLYAASERFHHPSPQDLEQAFDAAYGAEFGARVLRPLLFEGATSAVHLAEASSRKRGTVYRTRVRARRHGEVALPTALAAYGDDGRELTRQRWPSDVTSLVATLETQERVARVVLDPDRALLLDDRVRDQVAHFGRGGPSSLLVHLLGLTQAYFSWMGP